LNESEFSYQAQSSVGPYTLIAQIGEGGMGTVWRARRDDGLMEREVAVKLIAIGMRTMAMRERFARERQILASLNHPNIAGLYDAGVTGGGQPYLVLELIDGERIDAFCDRNALPVAGRLRLFLQVLAAVSHAHQHLVVHRDLKPANILITPAGEAKLLDFGVSKLLDGEEGSSATSDLTRDAGRLLTPEYAAPEQLKNRPVTTATDVYALGVLLYQLLTGCLPYAEAGDAPISLAQAIIEADPPRASTVATRAATMAAKCPIPAAQNEQKTEQISPEIQSFSPTIRAEKRSTTTRKLSSALAGDLDNILAKALRKDPYERYATVTEFADDIRAHLELRPVKAQPDSMTYRTQKFVRRNRGMVATAGFTMFAILAGVAATAWQANEARKQTLIAQREASKANAIRDYMVSMFRAVGRDAKEFPKRGNTTARELLDNAAQKVGSEFNEQPEVRAFMRETLSGLYADLDKNPQALSQATQWLEDAEKLLPPAHPQLVGALLQQALVLGKMNRAKDAFAVLDRVRVLLEPMPRSEQWVRLHLTRGYLHSAQYEPKTANEAIDEARRHAEPFPKLRAELDYAQGQVAFQEGRYRFGQEKLEAAIDGYLAEDGDGSVRVAEARWRLGIVQLYRNDWLGAEKEFSASWSAFREQTEGGHRDAIVVQRDLAVAKSRLGQREQSFAMADDFLQRAKLRTIEDKNIAFLAGAYQAWGRIHYFAGDLIAAHRAFESGYNLMLSTKPNERYEAISSFDLTLTTALLGETEKAAAMAQKIIAIYETHNKPDSPAVVTAKVMLADAIKKSNPKIARAWIDQGLRADWSEMAFPSTLVRAHLVASELAFIDNDATRVEAELAKVHVLLDKHIPNPEAKYRSSQADVLAVRLLKHPTPQFVLACSRIDDAVHVISQFNVANSENLTEAKGALESCRATAKLT
jgi:serine/threonine protein kinase/tetratricopeptide (TPR) repeat protein